MCRQGEGRGIPICGRHGWYRIHHAKACRHGEQQHHHQQERGRGKIHNVSTVLFFSSACVYPEYLQDRDYEELGDRYVLKESDAFRLTLTAFTCGRSCSQSSYTGRITLDHGLGIRIAWFHNIQGTMTAWRESRCKAPAALCRKTAMLPPEGGEIEVWGDGHQVRPFLNVKDCCEAAYRLMQCSDNEYYVLGEHGKPR